MSDRLPQPQESLLVRELVSTPELGLDLEVIQGHRGMEKTIRSPRIQKLGLTLAGFTGYIHPTRIQVFGGSEHNYLLTLDAASRKAAVARLEGCGISCILVTKNLDIPEGLLELAFKESIPLLRTSALSSVAILKITSYLEERLAPSTTIHGVLIDMFGLGVLLLGPSGIGKSECALELVIKGHRLVTDDAVVIRRKGAGRLIGSGGPVLKHHMELRGLGIIDIKELLGISATGSSQSIDLAIRLEKWNPDSDYDRIGVEPSTVELLGAAVPLIQMPVAPGRNIATLVEVAARTQLLRTRGYPASGEPVGHPFSEKKNPS